MKSPENIYLISHPYGYQINIGHPKIDPLYRRYKERNGIPPWCALSDDERMKFESYIFELIKKHEVNPYSYENTETENSIKKNSLSPTDKSLGQAV